LNLLSANEHQVVFGLFAAECELLERTLRLYPVMPASVTLISKTADHDDLEERQELLDELTRESKAENLKLVGDFLRRPRQFESTDGLVKMLVLRKETNWLLEVVNEIRVGIWQKLGDPEEEGIPFESDHMEDWVSMDYCAEIQSKLLMVLMDPDEE
jgi:hypothetical protein